MRAGPKKDPLQYSVSVVCYSGYVIYTEDQCGSSVSGFSHKHPFQAHSCCSTSASHNVLLHQQLSWPPLFSIPISAKESDRPYFLLFQLPIWSFKPSLSRSQVSTRQFSMISSSGHVQIPSLKLEAVQGLGLPTLRLSYPRSAPAFHFHQTSEPSTAPLNRGNGSFHSLWSVIPIPMDFSCSLLLPDPVQIPLHPLSLSLCLFPLVKVMDCPFLPAACKKLCTCVLSLLWDGNSFMAG